MAFKPKTASMVFYVSDIRRTETFYNETLGLGLERMEGAEPFWLQGKLAGGLELVYFEMPAKRGDSPAIVFVVDEGGIDDVVADLAAKGVTIVTPVSEAPAAGAPTFWTRMALASASGNRGKSREA